MHCFNVGTLGPAVVLIEFGVRFCLPMRLAGTQPARSSAFPATNCLPILDDRRHAPLIAIVR